MDEVKKLEKELAEKKAKLQKAEKDAGGLDPGGGRGHRPPEGPST